MRHPSTRLVLIAALLAGAFGAAPAAAQAVIYCCDDAGGKRVCGDFLPKECQRRAYEERDDKGFIIKRVEAPLTPAQIALREAEQARKAEAEQKRIEERRRNMALLSTYAEERDIDAARDRALADLDKSVKQAEKALADSSARRAKVDQEKEFYKNKTLPAQLKDQIALADKDVAVKRAAMDDRLAERQSIINKYAQEKRKFRELKRGGEPEPDPSAPKREVVVQPNEGAASESRGEVSLTPATQPAPANAPAPAPAQPQNDDPH